MKDENADHVSNEGEMRKLKRELKEEYVEVDMSNIDTIDKTTLDLKNELEDI